MPGNISKEKECIENAGRISEMIKNGAPKQAWNNATGGYRIYEYLARKSYNAQTIKGMHAILPDLYGGVW